MLDPLKVAGPVAMITGTYPSFSMTFVDREVRALRAMGCEVVAFALRKPIPEWVSGSFQAEEFERVIALYALARQPADLIMACLTALRQPRRLASTLCLAIEGCIGEGPGVVRQMAYLCAAILLARQVRLRRIAHIHNHLGDSSGTVAMLASELTGVPFSMTLHGPEIFDEARCWDLSGKIARAAFIACISKFCRARAMLHCDPANWPKLKIVRCGIEPAQYTMADCRNDGSRLLFIGRLETRKGVATLIDAMSQLQEKGVSAHLTIVGQGTMLTTVENRIMATGLEEEVTLAGRMDEAEVAEALRHADIVIVPSLAEGLPIVIMEGMAAGLPVIASAVDGIPELVVDGVTGMLVPPADADALAEAIERLLSDSDLRSRLGRAGHERIRHDHDAAKNARGLLEFIASHGRDPIRSSSLARPTAQAGSAPTIL